MSSRLQKRLTNVLVIALSLMALTVVAARGSELRSQFGGQEPGWMLVQRPRDTRDLWRQVYELMPELPWENQYVSQATGRWMRRIR